MCGEYIIDGMIARLLRRGKRPPHTWRLQANHRNQTRGMDRHAAETPRPFNKPHVNASPPAPLVCAMTYEAANEALNRINRNTTFPRER
ncbi:hypothetical protein E2C01_056523 [Portunus trituberculatus]|uniref:Uncharacterized protein n=1 Tax=Portunus trituberculatus TaxID=210409 RepID=A0A5B7GZT3_PORTR|nr:hypothetical protein [Portunus trituberculatus]